MKAVSEQKLVEIIVDNLNFTTHACDERKSKHRKMHHYIASAILVDDLKPSNVLRVQLQITLEAEKAKLFIPSNSEQKEIVTEYAMIAIRIAVKHIPAFKFLDIIFPKFCSDPRT